MRTSLRTYEKSCLMLAAGASALLFASGAYAQVRKFDVREQSAATGIPQFGKQAELQILAPQSAVAGKRVNAVRGAYTVEEGLARLLRAEARRTSRAPCGKRGRRRSRPRHGA